MKKPFILLIAVAGFILSCEKDAIIPRDMIVDAAPPAHEKEQGRKVNTCHLKGSDGSVIGDGLTCLVDGGSCGRKPRCSVMIGGLVEPDVIVFEGMTRKEVAEMWNTDEGMETLMKAGFYAVTED